MNKENKALLASFMPPLCMGILMLFQFLFEKGQLETSLPYVAMAEAVAFLIPLVLLLLLPSGEQKAKRRLGWPVRRSGVFVFFMSLVDPTGALLLNFLFLLFG